MALKPRSTKRSSSLNEVASSAVQPKTLPPSTSGAISRPERPSLRLSMGVASGVSNGSGNGGGTAEPECGKGSSATWGPSFQIETGQRGTVLSAVGPDSRADQLDRKSGV